MDVLALAEADRPLIGAAEEDGVIDPDVLWSCTTCGACVEQCPVDIEHVDHIVDMRRYQVLIESSFPAEAGVMLRNLENKGNPWGAPPNTREDWTKGLDFEVPRVGEVDDFEYLFWVGCAGAFEDRAKKTTRAVATLLHEAGVDFAILGEGETCTGDPARRIGNEFVFQMLAQQNVETLNEAFGRDGQAKIVATCPHCFNTLGNEYGQLGGDVRGRAPHPAAGPPGRHRQAHPGAAGRRRRHLPRPLLPGPAQPGLRAAARGARRPRVGAAGRPDRDAAQHASAPSAAAPAAPGCGWRRGSASGSTSSGSRRPWPPARRPIAVGCPFCLTMLSDGVTGAGSRGRRTSVEVVDVAHASCSLAGVGVNAP